MKQTSLEERTDSWSWYERSDDIPAMLSDGEFVVNAKAVRGIGRLFNGKIKDKKNARRKALEQCMRFKEQAKKQQDYHNVRKCINSICKPKRISDNN